MIKILIFEDDKKDLDNLETCLNVFFSRKNIQYISIIETDPVKVLNQVYGFDIFFLDIEVNDNSGIELGMKIRECRMDAKIIFTTFFPSYLIEGYKAQANRYFLKPIQHEEFNIEMENVLFDYLKRFDGFWDENIYSKKIHFNEIQYIEYLNRKTYLHLVSGNVIRTSYPLKYWKSFLSKENFAQSYKAYIVNLNHVCGFKNEEIIMDNEDIIPISRSYKKDFETLYYTNLEKRL